MASQETISPPKRSAAAKAASDLPAPLGPTIKMIGVLIVLIRDKYGWDIPVWTVGLPGSGLRRESPPGRRARGRICGLRETWSQPYRRTVRRLSIHRPAAARGTVPKTRRPGP